MLKAFKRAFALLAVYSGGRSKARSVLMLTAIAIVIFVAVAFTWPHTPSVNKWNEDARAQAQGLLASHYYELKPAELSWYLKHWGFSDDEVNPEKLLEQLEK